MNPTKYRYPVDTGKIVIFGAGKIGRSFIGQLFGQGGYKVVFVDIDQDIIGRLNESGSYRIVIKGDTEEEIVIRNVEAISAGHTEMAAEVLSSAGIAAISVGKNAIEKVIPVIASGLKLRYARNPGFPLDIILAENMISAAEFVRDALIRNLPAGFPVDNYVGLIETSIGKMVPIMPLAELEKDPLVIFAEPYNTLILDAAGFKNPVPQVNGLAPKSNIKAWVDRKAFIHNLGHATAAYYGYYLYPEAVYMYEILDHSEVLEFTREVMLQSADILLKVYPADFTASDLEEHIDDLIIRFRNKALRDTIYRVGHDLTRKLGTDDRFMGAIHLAMQYNMPYEKIVKAMSFGFVFDARDESGNIYPPDLRFLDSVDNDFQGTLTGLSGLDPVNDLAVISKLKELYRSL